MFERRLKIFLGVLAFVTITLLLRSIQLQVFGREYWAKQAIEINKRGEPLETTRGRILDIRGREIALDEACLDACVDYRAIVKDQDWMEEIAIGRLRVRARDEYRKAGKEARRKMIDEEVENISREIDHMWDALARESNQTLEQLGEITQSIRMRVEMRRRLVWYKRFESDQKRRGSGPAPWYSRWLSSDVQNVDNFAIELGEEVTSHPILRDISPETNTRLGRQLEHFPGLQLRPGSRRRYPYGVAGCHLLGQLAQNSGEQEQKSDDLKKYLPNDVIGRGGIEELCEPILRGTRGRIDKVIGEDQPLARIEPIPGGDVQATIDIELQSQMQSMFRHAKVRSNRSDEANVYIDVPGGMHGAAVVIEVASGEVRAMASYPDFDPNQMSEKYNEMLADKLNLPLLNRATQAALEPGSTIKPVVGLGAIQQGVSSATQGIECTGFLILNGKRYTDGKCWEATKFLKAYGAAGVAHHPHPIPHQGRYGNADGFLCFSDALERSCNVYFETLASKLGGAGLAAAFDEFGLGRGDGIGIAERSGRIPHAGEESVRPSIVWFSGIGQAGVLATPLQMANVAATIARDGVWMRPRLVRADLPTRSTTKPLVDRVDLHLPPEAIAAAKEGMTRVVNSPSGTGTAIQIPEVLIAGKTGTAQAAPLFVPARDASGQPLLDGKHKPVTVEMERATRNRETATPWYRGWGEDGSQLNHAWYIGFAPANHPQIAFAVMLEYGGSGGSEAAPIAKGIINACIEHGYLTAGR